MTLWIDTATTPATTPQIDSSSNAMGRGRPAPKSARCRSHSSSNWDKDGNQDDSGGDDHFDVTAATIPAPSHQMHAMPALWISGRRRHSRGRVRRRTVSENCSNNVPYSNHSSATDSAAASMSATLPTLIGNNVHEQLQLREAAAAASGSLNLRLKIVSPDGPRFAGWVRGQAAEVQWEALDPSVQCVRIDVCNVAWTVPTTIAHRVANDGTFRWRRVYWGMPIAEGYYVNIYDVTEQKDPNDLPLLAQSERFAVIK